MESHAGLDFVDVLSSGTGTAESVPTDTGGVDFHFDGIVDERYHEDRRERCHSFALRVVGADANQTVYTVLGLEITVRHLAFYVERHGLDTGLVPFLQVFDGDLVVMFLAVTHIHTHQLLGPVLGFCATCAGNDLQHGRHLIFLMRQHILHLQVFHLREGVCVRCVHLFFGHQFLFVIVEGEGEFFYRRTHSFVTFNPALDPFDLAHLYLSRFGVVPETGGLGVQLFLLQLDTFLVYLKVGFELVRPLLNIFQLLYRDHIDIFFFSLAYNPAK